MIKFVNNKKNKIIVFIAIIIIVISIIVLSTISKEKETRQTIISVTNREMKINEWVDINDAVRNVSRIFFHMKDINNDYNFYRKYLSEKEISSILSRGYNALFAFGLTKEEVDKLLILFTEDEAEGYNSFDNYMKLLGEKAYYKKEYINCSARIYTTIYDDFIIVRKKILNKDSTKTAQYKLILKDKDSKILDVIDDSIFSFGYDYDKSYTIYDKPNVDKVEYYFNSCY